MARRRVVTGVAAAGPGAGSCCSTSDGGGVPRPSPGAKSRIGVLADVVAHLDPHLGDRARDGAGTSIVALSDSSVITGSSALTLSPALTVTSITGMSLKSPMSGTRTSVVVDMAFLSDLRVGRGLALASLRACQARAGLGLSVSMP